MVSLKRLSFADGSAVIFGALLFAHPRSEDLLAKANGLQRDLDKLVLSYVFEGVFQGHLAHWREVEGVVFT